MLQHEDNKIIRVYAYGGQRLGIPVCLLMKLRGRNLFCFLFFNNNYRYVIGILSSPLDEGMSEGCDVIDHPGNYTTILRNIKQKNIFLVW